MIKAAIIEKDDFLDKIEKGLKLSSERMMQSKNEKNQSLVIMRDGKIITIKAAELAEENQI